MRLPTKTVAPFAQKETAIIIPPVSQTSQCKHRLAGQSVKVRKCKVAGSKQARSKVEAGTLLF